MFTIQQINGAHSKVKSGADFPKYIQDLIRLGVSDYTIYVYDGHAEYTGKNNFLLKSDVGYPNLNVVEKSDTEHFKQRLKAHQQGLTDYLTFCKDAANSGVGKWVVNLINLVCTYYDKSGNQMVEEKIPTP